METPRIRNCFDPQYKNKPWTELRLHAERQDTTCDAWKRLEDLIEKAAADGREEFVPGREMPESDWSQILTLPSSIAKLKAVKHLMLYGSYLVRIPPEIGQMTSLEKFTPYTSYRLHWFPYEITHCSKLKESTVSTRALYGNYKYRSPFPRLPSISDNIPIPDQCSICREPFTATVRQLWISLRLATDVLPLLVHACSEKCISSLPEPPKRYVSTPHEGGLALKQPPAEF
jgi:hypothetical protein